MDIFLQIIFSGITVGSMYAVGAIALSLLWGTMGMLNLAHASFIALGGYISYWCMSILGGHWIFVLPLAFIVGILGGYIFYHLVVRHIYAKENFEVNIIIASVAVAALVENLLLNLVEGEAKRQPFLIPKGLHFGDVVLPYQTILTVFIAIILMTIVALILNKTNLGRVIRAVSQNPQASKLMGIDVKRSFAQAMMLYGSVAAISGVLVTGQTQLFPEVGYDTMLKALVILIIAGLGNIRAGVLMAFVLGMFEMAVQYLIGARYGFPAMLSVVIIVLLFRPNGLFGKEVITRV